MALMFTRWFFAVVNDFTGIGVRHDLDVAIKGMEIILEIPSNEPSHKLMIFSRPTKAREGFVPWSFLSRTFASFDLIGFAVEGQQRRRQGFGLKN
jgi:hypothetical protein